MEAGEGVVKELLPVHLYFELALEVLVMNPYYCTITYFIAGLFCRKRLRI